MMQKLARTLDSWIVSSKLPFKLFKLLVLRDRGIWITEL
jgi:hypothetical protein